MRLKKVSLQDIAISLNVSKSLVSFVLNGQGDEKGINQETQQRVLSKATELNYKPNYIARGLRIGKSNTIGLVVADISNKFYSKIAKRVEEVAARNNYNLIFCSSDENPEKEIELIEMLRERQVDGLIISTTQYKSTYFSQLKKEQFPFVLIDRQIPKLKTNYVGVENYQGAYLATKQLIDNGYRKIAMFKISPSYLSTVRERENGYKDALKENDIRPSSKLIKEMDFNKLCEKVRLELAVLLQPPYNINGIFSVNNNITVACLECLNEMNIRIPQDLALISFDDIDLFRLSYPTITAIAQPLEDIGEEAVKILLDAINGGNNDIPKRKVLPVEFIQRRSCGSFLKNFVEMANV